MIGNRQILPVSHPLKSPMYDFTAIYCMQLRPFILFFRQLTRLLQNRIRTKHLISCYTNQNNQTENHIKAFIALYIIPVPDYHGQRQQNTFPLIGRSSFRCPQYTKCITMATILFAFFSFYRFIGFASGSFLPYISFHEPGFIYFLFIDNNVLGNRNLVIFFI